MFFSALSIITRNNVTTAVLVAAAVVTMMLVVCRYSHHSCFESSSYSSTLYDCDHHHTIENTKIMTTAINITSTPLAISANTTVLNFATITEYR